MNLQQIISQRHIKGQNHAQAIIYEWEDIISKELNIPITSRSLFQRAAIRFGIHSTLFSTYCNSLYFITNAEYNDFTINKKNIFPFIIDFFLKDNQLQQFYSKHSRNKVVFLSSPFDYEYLLENNCPIPISLVAYSLPDKYAIEGKKFDKKYDIVLTGRQDPLLYSFFKEYINKHPDVSYVKRGKDCDDCMDSRYYLNGKELIGEILTREQYMALLSQAKVSLYGTQGYVKNDITTGFYHVTPRFLEIIACGCQVLAHYPDCPDSKYYQLSEFSPSIESYEAFEHYMDKALNSHIDLSNYSTYLKQHYTSMRVRQVVDLLKEL